MPLSADKIDKHNRQSNIMLKNYLQSTSSSVLPRNNRKMVREALFGAEKNFVQSSRRQCSKVDQFLPFVSQRNSIGVLIKDRHVHDVSMKRHYNEINEKLMSKIMGEEELLYLKKLRKTQDRVKKLLSNSSDSVRMEPGGSEITGLAASLLAAKKRRLKYVISRKVCFDSFQKTLKSRIKNIIQSNLQEEY